MLISRSDWCISRQRSWGVPIPVFYHKETDEPLMTPETVAHIKGIVAEKGTNAWFELDEVDLLPESYKATADQYVKGTDTMDVWFDSGTSWAAVKADLGSPEQLDLYLEGSDQHRGWFQSSLITSVACSGKAPYKRIVTHGFCVDGQGKKMSKSIGNVIDPYTIIDGGSNQKKDPPLGADVLRYWVAATDYTNDVSISKDILGSVADRYKKLRNRFRFLLGNINDFDPAVDGVDFESMPLLDQNQILEAEETFRNMTEAYDSYRFSRSSKLLIDLLQDMSSVYLEVAKDRLYIAAKDSVRRRSCQTVIHWLVKNMARVVSPVLSHLAEDIWQNLPHAGPAKSVFLSGWWVPFPRKGDGDADVLKDFKQVLLLRDPVNQAGELARKAKVIRDALEAKAVVSIPADSRLREQLRCLEASGQPNVDNLTDLLGVSLVEVVVGDAPEDAEGAFSVQSEELGITVTITKTSGRRCERCWMWLNEVGGSQAHPDLCRRCERVVEDLGVPQAVAA